MNWWQWLILGFLVISLGTIIAWAGIMDSRENKKIAEGYDKRSKERYTYMGRVTAIVGSRILLNSNHQTVKTNQDNPQLIIGRHYEIVVDGNGYIIDATLAD